MFSSNSTKLQPEKIFTHVIKLPFMGMHSIQTVKFLHSEEIAERQKEELQQTLAMWKCVYAVVGVLSATVVKWCQWDWCAALCS